MRSIQAAMSALPISAGGLWVKVEEQLVGFAVGAAGGRGAAGVEPEAGRRRPSGRRRSGAGTTRVGGE